MRDRLIAAAAEKMGYEVDLGDFIACGRLRPTATGLELCRTYGFAHELFEITEGEKMGKMKKLTRNGRKKVRDALNQSFFYTAIAICTDETGKTEATDADITEFIAKNRSPLARLIGAAYITNFPGVVSGLGIAAE